MPSPRPILVAAIVLLVSACARHGVESGARASAAPSTATASVGASLYRANCASCHGEGGEGGRIGPALTNERRRKSVDAIRALIADPDPPMPKLYPSVLNAQDVDDLSAYVETL